jgi:ethanolamine ammonia-lyase small subunit
MRTLRSFTNARVDLGRAGDSVPTPRLLEFRLAHAQARDAVQQAMDSTSMVHEFALAGWDSMVLASQAKSREEYLLRPDLGRILSQRSVDQLTSARHEIPLLYCVADGLSAAAIHRHAANLLKELTPPPPLILLEQARVALGDCVGELVMAEVCVLLIGERPGLSSPDSLGVYITYQPKPGRSDAERNCVSNIHDHGLSYAAAAQKINYVVHSARQLKLTGVQLKERAGLLEN